MLPEEEIASRVVQIIAKSKALPPESITPASTFEDLQIDSLDKINLTFEIEESFKIAIPDDSLNSLRTVGDIIAGVQALVAAKPDAKPEVES
jgi:acyl carrier protein